MLDVIKATLNAWVSQLDAQRVSESNYSDEHDVYLDYKVLGVATFLKHVAYQQDDLELLAIASKVEMQVEQMILADDEEQDEAEQERQEMQQRIYESKLLFREKPLWASKCQTARVLLFPSGNLWSLKNLKMPNQRLPLQWEKILQARLRLRISQKCHIF